jgi:hypothetical protein
MEAEVYAASRCGLRSTERRIVAAENEARGSMYDAECPRGDTGPSATVGVPPCPRIRIRLGSDTHRTPFAASTTSPLRWLGRMAAMSENSTSVTAAIREVLKAHWRDGGLPPREVALHIVDSAITQFRPASISDHGGYWNGAVWLKEFSTHHQREGFAELDRLVHDLADGGNIDRLFITRRDVFERSQGDPVELFLAAMTWGHGTSGYGASRTRKILAAAGAHGISELVGELRRIGPANPEASWTACQRTQRLQGLGPAFATKVAYFAAFDCPQRRGPLIADRRTAWALWALSGEWDSRYSGPSYGRYVMTAGDWASSLGSAADDVERALFDLGPTVIAAWRDVKARN